MESLICKHEFKYISEGGSDVFETSSLFCEDTRSLVMGSRKEVRSPSNPEHYYLVPPTETRSIGPIETSEDRIDEAFIWKCDTNTL